ASVSPCGGPALAILRGRIPACQRYSGRFGRSPRIPNCRNPLAYEGVGPDQGVAFIKITDYTPVSVGEVEGGSGVLADPNQIAVIHLRMLCGAGSRVEPAEQRHTSYFGHEVTGEAGAARRLKENLARPRYTNVAI